MTNPTNTENHPNHPDGINEKSESSNQEVALLFNSNIVASEDHLADTTTLPQQHVVTGRSEQMIHAASLNMETTNKGASQGPNRMSEGTVLDVLDADETANEKDNHLDTTTAPLSLSSPSTLPTSPTTATTTHPVLRAGKRPSPWREPRTTGRPPPPAREIIKSVQQEHDDDEDDDEETRRKKQVRLQKRKERRCKYLCSGSICVNVPMTVTADLGVALRRGRTHRIQALYRHFPQLQTKPGVDGNDQVENGDGPKSNKAAPKKILRHVPQPHEYANVIDYLEAKYVQGVVISDDLDEYDDNAGGDMEEDDEEGHGSVYSETSFLDDTGLQRTVAEQVLGHTTTTKLELMNHEDGGFFVNVGDLEVEETDLTQEMYDPIHDTSKESLKKKKKSRKRKTSSNDNENRHVENSDKPTGSTIGSKKNKVTKPAAKPGPVETNSTDVGTKDMKSSTPAKNKKMKVEEKRPDLDVTISPKVKKVSVIKTETIMHQNPVTMKLQKIAIRKKGEITEHLNKLTTIIENLTDEELPRKAKPKRTRLVVQVPVGKQSGDTITCANPYVPGQKFKVKVPANVKAGEKFKVNVSKPAEDNDDDKLGEDGLVRDHNKFNRDFYDVLDDYAKAFDEWCDAEGAYRRAIDDKTFTSHYIKRSKCDDLVSLFPNHTKTEISVEYLKKVIRRARQNKHKRELTMAKQQMSFIEEHQDLIAQNSDGDNNASAEEEDDEDDNDDDDNVDYDKIDNSNNNPTSFDDENNNEVEARYKSLKANSSAKGPVTKRGMKPLRTAILPEFSSVFPSMPFHIKDFAEVS